MIYAGKQQYSRNDDIESTSRFQRKNIYWRYMRPCMLWRPNVLLMRYWRQSHARPQYGWTPNRMDVVTRAVARGVWEGGCAAPLQLLQNCTIGKSYKSIRKIRTFFILDYFRNWLNEKEMHWQQKISRSNLILMH